MGLHHDAPVDFLVILAGYLQDGRSGSPSRPRYCVITAFSVQYVYITVLYFVSRLQSLLCDCEIFLLLHTY